MKLKPAEINDISWIIELENSEENKDFIWQGSYEEHLEEIHDPDSFLFIHFSDSGEKVGYSLNTFRSRSKNFEIRRIAISKKSRGYGKESMLTLMDYGFNRLGAQRIWLDVYPHNKIGIKLYQGLGFTQEAHLRRSDFQRGRYYDQLIFSMLREEYKNII